MNPASCERTHHPILEREIELAQRLQVPYLILHPGVAVNNDERIESIEALVKIINTVHAQQEDVTIVLENTAHDNRSVVSEFEHLKLILDRLDDKERIRFCIDTAHAYAYGYDMSDRAFHDTMIKLIDSTIGIERVVLIHLNDTKQPLASFVDRHSLLGEGLIGCAALQAFVCDERLAHIPLILELPLATDSEYKKIVKMVSNWRTV